MIEAKEKDNAIQDQLEALKAITEMKTRISLLVQYIYDLERREAKGAVEFPHSYNVSIEKVTIPVSRVLWLLGFDHDEKAAAMFDQANEEFLRQQAAEEKKGAAEDGKEIPKEQP